MHRRALLAAPAALALPCLARAQAPWPERPVRILVPFAPGGNTDGLARLSAELLQEALPGASFVVENRTGAGGLLAADALVRSPPDGHVLMMVAVAVLAVAPVAMAQPPRFDPVTDVTPIVNLGTNPFVLMSHRSVEATDLASMIAWMRARSGRFAYASGGVGSFQHLSMELLLQRIGVQAEHVPYRGGAPALLSLVANESNLTMAGSTQSMNYVVNGQMRGIAVTGPRRFANLPDLPTFRELGWPEPDAGTWQGLLVQGQTPPAMVARLEREIAAVLNEPAIKARIGEIGGEVQADGAESFRRRLVAQTESYGEIIRANNVRLE